MPDMEITAALVRVSRNDLSQSHLFLLTKRISNIQRSNMLSSCYAMGDIGHKPTNSDTLDNNVHQRYTPW